MKLFSLSLSISSHEMKNMISEMATNLKERLALGGGIAPPLSKRSPDKPPQSEQLNTIRTNCRKGKKAPENKE